MYIADTWNTAVHLTALHDWEIPWEEGYRNGEAALAAGKAATVAEQGKVSEFLLVVEDRLPDLRRGQYASDIVQTDDGDDGGGSMAAMGPRCVQQPRLFDRQ
jgi:hypothetical protein